MFTCRFLNIQVIVLIQNMTTPEIINDPFSSYKQMSSVRHICLPPRYLGNVSQGVRDQLDSEINLYCTDLESVVISYENLKLLQAVGSILDDSPFLHFKIQADYVVFKPNIGCVLKGIVNKVSKDHVGCLVHNRFNASIHRPRQHMNGWRGSQLQQGEEFPFEVLDIYSNNAVISLKGKLIDQKAIEAYLKSLNTGGPKDKSESDKTVTESDRGDYVDYNEGEITLDSDPVPNKKRKRKSSNQTDSQKVFDEGNSQTDEVDLPQLETPKKRKKTSSKSQENSTPGAIKTTSAFEDVESSTPLAGKKRKHSLRDELNSSTPVSSSAKKVRFHSSCLKSSPDSGKKGKGKYSEISPISSVDEVTNVHDGSYLDSSMLDVASSSSKKLKKKKHKKGDRDKSESETELTRLKSQDESSQDVKNKNKKSEGIDNNVSGEEICELSSQEKRVKKKKKKKNKSESDFSNSESSDGQSLVLSQLAEGFGKNFSNLQKNFSEIESDPKNKKNKKVKDLIEVMQSLQSEVANVTTKLMAANVSGKKKKQKKKKNRESSSSDGSSDCETSRRKSKQSSHKSKLSSRETSRGDNSSDEDSSVNVSKVSTDLKKRSSAEHSDVTKKKKKKVNG